VFSDPFSVTYNSASLSLPRVEVGKRTSYRTADGEFVVYISNSPLPSAGNEYRTISLVRSIPDPVADDAFTGERPIVNAFGIYYAFDTSQYQTSVDIPRLRTALLAVVDSTFQGRLLTGEK
jgi:hypothetical protein